MKLLAAFGMLVMVAAYVAASGVPTKVTYVPSDKVSATMAKGGAIIEDTGLRVLAQRRGSGEVEVHDTTNHVFIIVEGEATLRSFIAYLDAAETAEVALKVGKPVARSVAKNNKAYLAAECPLAGEHIVQGLDRLDDEKPAIARSYHPIELFARGPLDLRQPRQFCAEHPDSIW